MGIRLGARRELLEEARAVGQLLADHLVRPEAIYEATLCHQLRFLRRRRRL